MTCADARECSRFVAIAIKESQPSLRFAASAQAMPTVPIQISKRVEDTLAIDF